MDGNWNSKLKSATELTTEWLLSTLQSLTNSKHFWIGYSGGLDSHVLLDLTAKIRIKHAEYQISAIHVHHGLSQYANEWALHCEAVCRSLQIPIIVQRVNAAVTLGRSPEEVAREARFKAFASHLGQQDCILLAHHADDQTETILLRLFRGAGPTGLSGISSHSKFGVHENEIARPLLSVSKEILLEYGKINNLQWLEDESNENLRFDRNFLRHEILPRLKTRWPKVVRSINRSAALCFEAANAGLELAASDWINVQGLAEGSLSVSQLLALGSTRRRGVIRYWLQKQNFALPSHEHLLRIEHEILRAKPDAHPQLKIGNYKLKRRKNDLIVQGLVECLT